MKKAALMENQESLFCQEAFLNDSLASRSPSPGTERARMMTVTSGRKCLELYKKSNPLGCLVRMLLESSVWHSNKCYLTWNVKVMKSKRLLFQLLESVPCTEENEFSFWATPNTMDSLPSRSYEAMKRQATNGGRKNRRRPGNLREQVDPLMCQAYKEARAEANGMMWPSPVASGKLNGGTRDFNKLQALKEQGQITEEERRSMSAGNGGQLNPDWVCWLMGFPTGWANISE